MRWYLSQHLTKGKKESHGIQIHAKIKRERKKNPETTDSAQPMWTKVKNMKSTNALRKPDKGKIFLFEVSFGISHWIFQH